MNDKNILNWGDVAYTVRVALYGLKQEWEALEWMWQSWEIIINTGLATYSNTLELYDIVLRFLALFSFLVELSDDWYTSYYYKYNLSFVDLIETLNIDNFRYYEILEYVNDYPSLWEPIYNESSQYHEKYEYLNSRLSRLIQAYRRELEKILIHQLRDKLKFLNTIPNDIDIDIYEAQEINAEFSFCIAYLEEELNNYKLLKKIDYLSELYKEIENDENYTIYYFNSEVIQELILNKQASLEEIESVVDAAEKLAQFFSSPPLNKRYTLAKFVGETGFDEAKIKLWVRTINRKYQAILYGSPGTGKTYIAEKLAQHLISGGDGFSELVQFHPAYSYEDFIQGIRPQSLDGKIIYPLVPGRFLEFCKKAESYKDTCVLIIDEINRANLAQVFGELMYLLEYRDREISLAAGNTFRIPKNVRIIGTMNTADRSIAQIDHALRRRFAFIELRPNYDVLRRYHLKTHFAVEGLIKILQQLNQAIADKNYELGISFFLTQNLRDDIEDIWCMEIEPYLEEYFFNQLEKIDEFRWNRIKGNLWI
ncbi:ATPase [Nostoc sp. NIES-4103]|nr:ATPase [Nostoc sp. NIES-4103]